uniref:Transposase Tc1-like domain-containing protein n=1 Tax=Cyprinus carpio carpio TaxID=630221 RepID=A0A9J8D825_CYPCA
MGKTADLTVVQKTTIDTLHKEGKTQKSSVSKHINREAKGRKRCGRKKCTSNRDNCTLERIVKQNPFKNVGEIHKEWTAAGVSASRTTMHRLMQDMCFSCHIPCVKPLLNNRQRQKRLASKRTGLLLSQIMKGLKLTFNNSMMYFSMSHILNHYLAFFKNILFPYTEPMTCRKLCSLVKKFITFYRSYKTVQFCF